MASLARPQSCRIRLFQCRFVGNFLPPWRSGGMITRPAAIKHAPEEPPRRVQIRERDHEGDHAKSDERILPARRAELSRLSVAPHRPCFLPSTRQLDESFSGVPWEKKGPHPREKGHACLHLHDATRPAATSGVVIRHYGQRSRCDRSRRWQRRLPVCQRLSLRVGLWVRRSTFRSLFEPGQGW